MPALRRAPGARSLSAVFDGLLRLMSGRKQSARKWLGVFAASCLACSHQGPLRLAAAPGVGSAMPCIGTSLEMIGPAELARACEVSVRGIVYRAASVDGTRVTFVETHDRAFSTPEGIGVGSTLAKVHKAGGSELRALPGWGTWSELPSGWMAAFLEVSEDPASVERQVAWLWRR